MPKKHKMRFRRALSAKAYGVVARIKVHVPISGHKCTPTYNYKYMGVHVNHLHLMVEGRRLMTVFSLWQDTDTGKYNRHKLHRQKKSIRDIITPERQKRW